MILFGTICSVLLWANPRSPFVWIVMLVTIGFGAIGFYDDYLKVKKQTHEGFSGRSRLAIEATIAGIRQAGLPEEFVAFLQTGGAASHS
jgi:phospho-N-acetylmuramoyl-pentapeptide-transferase